MTNLGISGRIAAYFQNRKITPLLALAALLLGLLALAVTPREEEPQIDVTMANVLVPLAGASAKDVENIVVRPLELVLSRMQGVEHVSAVSVAGMATLTVQFEVGIKRQEALSHLYDAVHSNADLFAKMGKNVQPIVKPKGIEDVPIVVLTLFLKDETTPLSLLNDTAHALKSELLRVEGAREVTVTGAGKRALVVSLDPVKLASKNLDVNQVLNAIGQNASRHSAGQLIAQNQTRDIYVGDFFHDYDDVANVVVGSEIIQQKPAPIFLKDVADIQDKLTPAREYVWHASQDAPRQTALTMAVSKKNGVNASAVADEIIAKVAAFENDLIAANIGVEVSRNYGHTADNKANQLIQKLFFATLSVVILVLFTLGWREALIIGTAVILTLLLMLFASYAYGFTLNRVSLFALIFSIGILVDDAIVVVENIHRHHQLAPEKTLLQIIPSAVDEVGGPTILATFTVIAALLPMAFVSGLMGPYMSPIPINASIGMLLSLAIAFVFTPYLSGKWLSRHPHVSTNGEDSRLLAIFSRIFKPFLGAKARLWRLGLLVVTLLLILAAFSLPYFGKVVLKMLPFDNKSELQVVVDLPANSPVEQTAALLQELGDEVLKWREVKSYQAFAGTSAPMSFNGLVRQYYLRQQSFNGDLQVNLHAHDRAASHDIALKMRPSLVEIAKRYQATLKVVEVPPGPPVQAPIYLQIYADSDQSRERITAIAEQVFLKTDGVVDVESSNKKMPASVELKIDQQKAQRYGVAVAHILSALNMRDGAEVALVHNAQNAHLPVVVNLSPALGGSLESLLALGIANQEGKLIPLGDLVSVDDRQGEPARYRKDLLAMSFVGADMAGAADSPLYAMFALRAPLAKALEDENVQEYFINTPDNIYQQNAMKWDGEWQITYETFRDMGLAYAVGLVIIYLLVVAHFGSYQVPLVIMMPIPLTLIGVLPGHALLGAEFTATSMIGVIALAGIIVRNSILLVDFIKLQLAAGHSLEQAVITSASTRAKPILLTGFAAMIGAFFILTDPIFNGLAIALIFGILLASILSMLLVPLLYYVMYQEKQS